MDKEQDHFLSNKTYNVLVRIVQLVLPALGTLYFALAVIWNLPAAKEVVGSLAALASFFGVILALSSRSYNKSLAKYDGEMVIIRDEAGKPKTYSLNLNSADPADLASQMEVRFKVQN